MKRETFIELGVFALLVTLGVVTRWISGQFTNLTNSDFILSNFTATGAVALFAGYYFRSFWIAAMAPLALLVVSNLDLKSYDSLAQLVTVYFAFILSVLLGAALRGRDNPWRIGGHAIAGSLAFYLITNFTYWPWHSLYPKTAAGLIECYLAAIPFFRNMLAADLFFSALIFGAHAAAVRFELLPRPAQKALPASAS